MEVGGQVPTECRNSGGGVPEYPAANPPFGLSYARSDHGGMKHKNAMKRFSLPTFCRHDISAKKN